MSKKIVTADIPWGNVYAYRKGDLIDDEAVKANGWEDYVASPTSKEAKQIRGETSGEAATEKS